MSGQCHWQLLRLASYQSKHFECQGSAQTDMYNCNASGVNRQSAHTYKQPHDMYVHSEMHSGSGLPFPTGGKPAWHSILPPPSK